MKELVEFIAKRLADHPEQIQVTESESEGVLTIHLKAAEEDKGRMIGKEGKVIKAIRALAHVAAAKSGRKVRVDVD
ncbi:MAG TPA: KH domain-containing protein [Elusimicrobiota bacterium]|nr:KH domain-containing protein [Elusimicrobiota bacterium]